MKPMAAAVAAALISGVAMYTVGAKTARVDAFTQDPALVERFDGQYVANSATALRPAAAPAVVPVSSRRAAPARRTVYRTSEPVYAPAQNDRVYRDERDERVEPERSWGKTAMIIGGSAASGAAVGGIVSGKKGALIGAAIGGGAASIYESTKRR